MIVTYVLVVVLNLHGMGSMHVTMQEFNGSQSCEDARQWVLHHTRDAQAECKLK